MFRKLENLIKREKASARASSDRFFVCLSALKPNIFSNSKFVSLLITCKIQTVIPSTYTKTHMFHRIPKEFSNNSQNNPEIIN